MEWKNEMKSIWLILIGVIVLTMFNPTIAFADSISDAMQKVIDVYPNSYSYFTSDGKSDSNSADSRCSLVNIPARGGLPSGKTVRDARGGDAHSCHAFAEYAWYVMFGHCTNTQTKTISASELKVGDFIRFSGHSAIYLGEDSKNYYVYDSNWANPADNKVRYNHAISKSRGIEKCYHATNYPDDVCNCSESYAGNYTCTSNSTLNIRSGHSTSSSVVGSIPSGATVYVSKSDGTWAHVEYNGVSGCASMSYLSKKPDYVDLGENFYASIYCTANGSVVTNDFDNVSGRVYVGNDNQKWIFWRCDAENGYTLRNAADWKMLTAGYSAYVSDENNQDNQVWYIVKNDFGSYSLISKADKGIALDLGGASSEEGANILTIESHQDWESQKWMIEKYNVYGNAANLGEHFYARIQNNKAQTFLTAMERYVQGYHDLQDNSQTWEFVRNGNGSYRILSVTTGGYMQVEWSGDRDGEKIICAADPDNAKRDWFIYQNGDSYFFCPSGTHTPQAIECYEGDGGIVQTWSYHEGWESQIFSIIPRKPMYHLDINGMLDGAWQCNLGDYGTCDVYINGELQADDCSDYYGTWETGTKYEIKDVRGTKCHRYNGVSAGAVSGTITGDAEVILSFSTEHSYDEGSISGNTITYKCLNCDAAKEMALLTLNNNDGTLTAEIVPTDKVIEQGIVYAKGEDVTLETPGRTRVVFTELTKDNTFVYEVSKAKGYAYRAYAKYTGGDGEEEVAYSETFLDEKV